MASPWRFIANFTHEDFAAGTEVTDISAYAIPARRQIEGVMIVPTVEFVVPGAAYYQVSLGVVGILDLYLAPYDLLGLAPGDAVFSFGTVEDIRSLAGWTMRAQAESDVDLVVATAGAFDLFIKLASIPAGS